MKMVRLLAAWGIASLLAAVLIAVWLLRNEYWIAGEQFLRQAFADYHLLGFFVMLFVTSVLYYFGHILMANCVLLFVFALLWLGLLARRRAKPFTVCFVIWLVLQTGVLLLLALLLAANNLFAGSMWYLVAPVAILPLAAGVCAVRSRGVREYLAGEEEAE